MFTPPWHTAKDVRDRHDRFIQLLFWCCGWCWSLLGLFLGALIATPILTRFGLINTPSQDVAAYGIAALCAFIVQLISFTILLVAVIPFGAIIFVPILLALLFVPPLRRAIGRRVSRKAADRIERWAFLLLVIAYALLSIAVESDAIWGYIQKHDVRPGRVITDAVGGFAIRAILFLAIKGFVTGTIAKRLFK
jgi:hypothetical protein